MEKMFFSEPQQRVTVGAYGKVLVLRIFFYLAGAFMLLQAYVTRYHTQKAQVDFEDAQRLYEDRKSEYYTKQQAYAAYADQNQSTVGLSRSVKIHGNVCAVLENRVYTRDVPRLSVIDADGRDKEHRAVDCRAVGIDAVSC